MNYIDFDQVILATEEELFKEYFEKKAQGIKLDKQKYLEEFDWDWLVFNSEVIADAIEIIKSVPNDKILTKVHSLKEASAKIKFLRSNNVKNEIIIVPGNHKKTDLVSAKGNILIDDAVHNLDDWSNAGGIAYFFNKDNLDTDNWGVTNTKYKKINNLKILTKEAK